MSDKKIDRFKKAGLIGCLNTECHKDGCRNLETRCKDCGRVVNSTVICLNDENKQSRLQNITEIPTNQGNSGWVDREIEFPNTGLILCYDGKAVFICQLVKSKWGNHYRSTDWGHNESDDPREWTHWMPLPEPPRKNGMD